MEPVKNQIENDDMVVTPERALKIKQALIRQYEDQFGVKVISWTETPKSEEASV